MLDFFRKLFRRWFGGPDTPPEAAEPAAEPKTQAPPPPPPADAAPEEPAAPPASAEPTGPAAQPVPIPSGDTAEATPVKPAPETAAPPTATPTSSRDLPSEPATRTEPRLAHAYDPHELRLDLVRYSHGPHDTLGRLYLNGEFVCYTHEAAAASGNRLPAGSFPLALREAGGRHAAYAFRFPDMHQGMLWIKAGPDQPYALIHLGTQHSDLPGSVAVGLEVKGEADLSSPRELWFSSRAYRTLYLPVATALAEGKPGQIVVENAED